MPVARGHLLTALAVTVVVGLAGGGGWAYFVMGAVLAVVLGYVMSPVGDGA